MLKKTIVALLLSVALVFPSINAFGATTAAMASQELRMEYQEDMIVFTAGQRNFTDVSWNAFVDALAEAKTELADPINSTVESMTNAKDVLHEALLALEEISGTTTGADTTETTSVTEPVTTEAVTTEAVTTEPITTEAVSTEPVSTEAATTEIVTTETVTTEAATTEPITTASVTTEAASTEPVTSEVVTTETVTTEAATTEPITTASVTTEAASTEPVTSEVVTTGTVTTEAATTEPITTASVTTEAVTTEPITTEAVTTEPITTESVTTEAATTESITTEAATTEPVTTTVEPATTTSTTAPSIGDVYAYGYTSEDNGPNWTGSQALAVGDSITFVGNASAIGKLDLSYQWFAVDGDQSNNSAITDVDSLVYFMEHNGGAGFLDPTQDMNWTATDPNIGMTYSFYCVVTGTDAGGASITKISNPVIVEVKNEVNTTSTITTTSTTETATPTTSTTTSGAESSTPTTSTTMSGAESSTPTTSTTTSGAESSTPTTSTTTSGAESSTSSSTTTTPPITIPSISAYGNASDPSKNGLDNDSGSGPQGTNYSDSKAMDDSLPVGTSLNLYIDALNVPADGSVDWYFVDLNNADTNPTAMGWHWGSIEYFRTMSIDDLLASQKVIDNSFEGGKYLFAEKQDTNSYDMSNITWTPQDETSNPGYANFPYQSDVGRVILFWAEVSDADGNVVAISDRVAVKVVPAEITETSTSSTITTTSGTETGTASTITTTSGTETGTVSTITTSSGTETGTASTITTTSGTETGTTSTTTASLKIIGSADLDLHSDGHIVNVSGYNFSDYSPRYCTLPIGTPLTITIADDNTFTIPAGATFVWKYIDLNDITDSSASMDWNDIQKAIEQPFNDIVPNALNEPAEFTNVANGDTMTWRPVATGSWPFTDLGTDEGRAVLFWLEVYSGTDLVAVSNRIGVLVGPVQIKGIDVVDASDANVAVPEVGQTLYANVVMTDDAKLGADQIESYKWFDKDHADVTLGTASSYPITSADADRTICLTVTTNDGMVLNWQASATVPDADSYIQYLQTFVDLGDFLLTSEPDYPAARLIAQDIIETLTKTPSALGTPGYEVSDILKAAEGIQKLF